MSLMPFPCSIMVTGGAGTFGQAFTRYVLTAYPDTILTLVSRSEYTQILARRAFADEPQVRFALGDVRDLPRMRQLCRGVDAVVHAAALKHVAIGEEAPAEVIATNIIGTQNVLQAVVDTQVRTCVVLSSDKAVDPANLYGVTKMAAERLTLAASRTHASHARFNLVRYGNIMGSRGSVLEVFQTLLDRGERCLPVTDLAMTRFFMTIQEAVALVCLTLRQPVSGYMFIPALPAFSLETLVQTLLHKDQLACELDYRLIGVQPGEKLHESLLTEQERRRTLWAPGLLPSGDCYAIRPHWTTTVKALNALGGWHPYSWSKPYQSGDMAYRMSREALQARLQAL